MSTRAEVTRTAGYNWYPKQSEALIGEVSPDTLVGVVRVVPSDNMCQMDAPIIHPQPQSCRAVPVQSH